MSETKLNVFEKAKLKNAFLYNQIKGNPSITNGELVAGAKNLFGTGATVRLFATLRKAVKLGIAVDGLTHDQIDDLIDQGKKSKKIKRVTKDGTVVVEKAANPNPAPAPWRPTASDSPPGNDSGKDTPSPGEKHILQYMRLTGATALTVRKIGTQFELCITRESVHKLLM